MKKQAFLVAVLLAALPIANPLRAEPAWRAFPPPSKVPDGYLQVIEPVAPGVHVIRQGDPMQVSVIGNIVVVDQGDGLVLFDAADSPAHGRRAVELIRRVSAKPVKAVVLSHWHSDHHFGLPAILEAWPGARIIAQKATADHIARRIPGVPVGAPSAEYDAEAAAAGPAAAAPYLQRAREQGMSETERRGYEVLAGLIEATAADGVGQYIVLPTETFTDRLVLDDPAFPIEALFLGAGNTDGDVVLWLPRQRVLATGDLVVSPIPYGINVYPTPWRQVLEKLETFDFAVLVPGHGKPQRDKTYLRDLQTAMDEVTSQVTTLAGEGLDLDAVRKRLSLAAQTDHFVGSDPWARRWFARYWYAPYAGCVYREIKGLNLVQGVGGSANCTTTGSLGP